jgi:hypothetical protein
MSKYRLAVAERVAVQIKGKLKGESTGTHANVNFTLDMDRVSQKEIDEARGGEETIGDFLVRHTRGWTGQQLVLDQEEGGKPAAFCEDAMRALLEFPGMTLWVYRAYMRDLGLQEKN